MKSKSKKYKKLTNAEKKMNKEARERLREEGLIPPVKPKLNRKKFSKETIEEFRNSFGSLYIETRYLYLYQALNYMLPHEHQRTVTPEEIGVVKILKLALELKKFEEEKLSKGETKYSPIDLYEKVIKPVVVL
ncbi:hypothetical protein [Anaerosolibacter sp.]|uniref:hypothetical protein n=1 Tax=Anaerosolibacter sp. TaxID=1872527 RepID=UPI0039EEAB76